MLSGRWRLLLRIIIGTLLSGLCLRLSSRFSHASLHRTSFSDNKNFTSNSNFSADRLYLRTIPTSDTLPYSDIKRPDWLGNAPILNWGSFNNPEITKEKEYRTEDPDFFQFSADYPVEWRTPLANYFPNLRSTFNLFCVDEH